MSLMRRTGRSVQSIYFSLSPSRSLCIILPPPTEHLNISVTLSVNCDTHLNPFSTSPSLHLFSFPVSFFFHIERESVWTHLILSSVKLSHSDVHQHVKSVQQTNETLKMLTYDYMKL